MKNVYYLGTEPRGVLYRSLIEWCCAESEEFQLVVRDTRSRGALRTMEALGADRGRVWRGKTWPGQELTGAETAAIYRIPIGPETATVMKHVANGLYDWREPRLPEDLSFFRGDEAVLLASIALDHYGWVELDSPAVTRFPSRVGAHLVPEGEYDPGQLPDQDELLFTRQLSWYPKKGASGEGRIVLDQDHELGLAKIFQAPAEDVILRCYPVEEQHRAAIEAIFGVALDLDQSDYFVEANIVGTIGGK